MPRDPQEHRQFVRKHSTQRRRILQALGAAAGTAALAGCVGDDDDDDPDPDDDDDDDPGVDDGDDDDTGVDDGDDDDDVDLADEVVAFGPDGQQISLGLMHDPGTGDNADIAAQIQSDLEDNLGIEVELLETSDILSELFSEANPDVDEEDLPDWAPVGRNAGPPELTRTVNGWDLLIGIGGNSRPRNPLATDVFWTPRSAINAYGYLDETMADLYDEANETFDRDERLEIISQIFGRLTTQAPANFLSEDESFSAFRPDINTGPGFNEFGFEGATYERYRGDQTVGGDYVVLTTGTPQTFYPPEADDTSSGAVIGNVADIAYALTADNTIVPQTIGIEDEGSAVGEDRGGESDVWICTVRDNIQFGEGAEGEDFGRCTADDWVWQINNVYEVEDNPWDEDVAPSVYTDNYERVENVEQTGELEFQIELPSPDPDFHLRPLLRNRYILPRALYEKYLPDAEALRQSEEVADFTWTGNLGPYEFVDNTPGPTGDVIFQRNDDYYMRDHTEQSNVQVMDDGYADAPYFETLIQDREEQTATINERWRNGEGDTMGLETDVVEEFQERDDSRVENSLGPFISSMFINQRSNAHPILREREGRFAICQVIDKRAITEDIQRGLSGPPAATWQPRWSEFYDDSEVVPHGIDIDDETIQNARQMVDDLDGFSVEER